MRDANRDKLPGNKWVRAVGSGGNSDFAFAVAFNVTKVPQTCTFEAQREAAIAQFHSVPVAAGVENGVGI